MTMLAERMRPVGWGAMSDLRPTGDVRVIADPPPVGGATYTRLIDGGVRVILPDQKFGEIWEIREWSRLAEVASNLREFRGCWGGGRPPQDSD